MNIDLTRNFSNGSHAVVPDTPYMRARQEWDSRIGSSVVQAKNWRYLSLLLGVTVLVLVVGIIVLATKQKHVPYIVEVAGQEVRNINKAEAVAYKPTEAQLRHHLIKFVEKIRSISIDHDVNKKWIVEAYSLLTPKTAEKFDNLFKTDARLAEHIKEQRTIAVKVTAFTKVTNNTYQLQWTEEVHDVAGKLVEVSNWVGFATIKIAQPKGEIAILQNPLGIWLTDFTWSKSSE